MKVTFYMGSFDFGGAEMVMISLANGFHQGGFDVDMVVETLGPLRGVLDPAIPVLTLAPTGFPSRVARLTGHLRSRKPSVIIVTSYSLVLPTALVAKVLVRRGTKLIVRNETDMNAAIAAGRTGLPRSVLKGLRMSLPLADAVVSVSNGAYRALIDCIPTVNRILHRVVYNPVVHPNFGARTQGNVEYDCFDDPLCEVVVWVGRLSKVKDVGTLLRAVAVVSQRRNVALVLIGDGPERQVLEELASELGISGRTVFAGFRDDPIPYMARADVFVVSSVREGLCSVLIEAMACGTQVVSTDCPSSPSEILLNGRLGPLTRVGDPVSLADGIVRALDTPIDPQLLKDRAMDFTVEKSINLHLEMIATLARNRDGAVELQ